MCIRDSYKAKWERAALYAYEVLQMQGMATYAALIPNELYDGGDEMCIRDSFNSLTSVNTLFPFWALKKVEE